MTKKKPMRTRRTTGKGKDSPTAGTVRESRALFVARDRLIAAIERACVARGEAQWTNGYRTARGAGSHDDAEDERLYKKERGQWAAEARAWLAVQRAIASYARAVRRVQ